MKVQWQVIKNFQDTWTTKFPWVETIIGEDKVTPCAVQHINLVINLQVYFAWGTYQT
jgi:hypothetical protein